MNTTQSVRKKRAVLLARVSKEEQSDNYSLSTQLARMREYAQSQGFVVMDEITDTYTAASSVASRPGGAKVYDYLRRHAIDVVILYTIDRAARDEDVLEYGIFKRDVKNAGAELHFTDIGKTSDDPMGGGLIEYLHAAQASTERLKIRERTQRGIDAKVAAGKWVGNGPEPYGYRKQGVGKGVTLHIYEPEAAIVRRIFATYAGHVGQTRSLRLLCDQLNAEGIPTPGRKGKGKGQGRGWYGETVKTILARTCYIGEFRYKKRPIFLPDLAIVDRGIWDAAQARRERNKALASRNRRAAYLLAGHIKCVCDSAACGSKMHRDNTDHLYYRCASAKLPNSLRTCFEHYVRANIADALVWAWLCNLLKNEAKLTAGLKEYAERNESMVGPKRERLATVVDLLSETDKEISRLRRAVARADEDEVAAQYEHEMSEAVKRQRAYKRECENLQSALSDHSMTAEKQAAILEWAREIRQGINEDDVSFEVKRRLLDWLEVEAKIMYREGVRGLYMQCSLKFGEKWEPLTDVIVSHSRP